MHMQKQIPFGDDKQERQRQVRWLMGWDAVSVEKRFLRSLLQLRSK